MLASNEAEAATQTLKSNGEKDKYKALARRLKDERNQYRETCEEKQLNYILICKYFDRISIIDKETTKD